MKFLDQFIKKTDALGQIRLTARQLNALVGKIRLVLPNDSRDHLVGCALRSDTVIVFVDSAAWATQFRYFQQAVLDVCRQSLGERIHHVQYKILPPEPITGNPPDPGLTKTARQLLRQTANTITDNELASALRRLSENSRDQDAD